MDTFTTERMVARRVRADDLDDLWRLHSDPAVMATLGGARWSREETAAFLDRLLAHWDRFGYGVWTFRDAATGAFLGRSGLRRKVIDGVEENELLYAVPAAHWGRGLATEAALAIAALAFSRLGLRDLVAFTLQANAASRRVMDKAGFTYERDIVHAGLPHVLYRRRSPEEAP